MTTGALLDVINALACIGTAVVLYPVVRRQSQLLALGFLASRDRAGRGCPPMNDAPIVTAITVALIALSAFFVAVEFALLAAKRHRLEDAAHESRSARVVRAVPSSSPCCWPVPNSASPPAP